MPVTSSLSPLQGAREINSTHLTFAYQDMGGKLAAVISTVNALITAVSTLNTAVSAINVSLQQGIVCAASFASAFSTVNLASTTATSTTLLTSYTSISNLTA